MRKILYAPGFGAGWVSWHRETREEKLFMLTYPPFIDRIENRQPISPADIAQFEADFLAKFPKAIVPYSGGIDDLCIMEIPDGVGVRITEYDGNESVILQTDGFDWL